ncbi:MAG: hypothetical protein J5651_00435 [Salinivirgaceae bacterium]|nr:hypothetical protein [Salinivirgaceae bacterium]
MSMKDFLGTIASSLFGSAVNREPVLYGVPPRRPVEPQPVWTRKKCKSCRLFGEFCSESNPQAAACCEYKSKNKSKNK